jgi:hypothetical protein
MRVQVDARHQREPAGVDDPRRVLATSPIATMRPSWIAPSALNRVVPAPVDYCCSADHEVMHHDSL